MVSLDLDTEGVMTQKWIMASPQYHIVHLKKNLYK